MGFLGKAEWYAASLETRETSVWKDKLGKSRGNLGKSYAQACMRYHLTAHPPQGFSKKKAAPKSGFSRRIG